MQTQRQQLNLYSNETLLFNNDNIDTFKKNMEEHYDYKVEQFDMKQNKDGNRCSIVVVRKYADKFPEQYSNILNTVPINQSYSSTLNNELLINKICIEIIVKLTHDIILIDNE